MQGNIHDDFLALQVVSGQLLFSYDLGSGRVLIRTNGSYNDGMLHRVSILLIFSMEYVGQRLVIGGNSSKFSNGSADYG